MPRGDVPYGKNVPCHCLVGQVQSRGFGSGYKYIINQKSFKLLFIIKI